MSRIVIVGLTTLPPSMGPLSRQYGTLNISQPYSPPRPVTRIVLLQHQEENRLAVLHAMCPTSAICTLAESAGQLIVPQQSAFA
jgi:hypothetical protein